MTEELTEGQRAIFRDMAFDAARAIGLEIKEMVKDGLREVRTEQAAALALHAATCPTAEKVKEIVAKGRGSWQTILLIVAILAWLTSTAIAIWK